MKKFNFFKNKNISLNMYVFVIMLLSGISLVILYTLFYRIQLEKHLKDEEERQFQSLLQRIGPAVEHHLWFFDRSSSLALANPLIKDYTIKNLFILDKYEGCFIGLSKKSKKNCDKNIISEIDNFLLHHKMQRDIFYKKYILPNSTIRRVTKLYGKKINDAAKMTIGFLVIDTYSNTSKTIKKEYPFIVFKVSMICIFFSLIIFYILQRFVLFPIERICQEAKGISSGKIKEVTAKVKTKELIELKDSLNIMISNIEKSSQMAGIASLTQMMAHDVRKPFTMLKSILEMLDIVKDNPHEVNKLKSDVNKAIKNVESMISDILSFSRDEKVELKNNSLTDIFKFSILQTSQCYKDDTKDIHLHYNFSHELNPLVDEEKLARVFMNLLGNAIEAIFIMGKKELGNIWISSKEENGMLQITLANDGPLFNSDDIPKLFDSFYTKGKKKGTGLGLSCVHKIVALHGGHISARNNLTKKRVEFIFTLPLSNQKNNDIEQMSQLPKKLSDLFFVEQNKKNVLQNDITTPPLKLLLLEDEALYRVSVRNTIHSNKNLHEAITLYEVQTVTDALKVIEAEKIEWAIVDIDLGEEKNGFDFLLDASRKFPSLKTMVHSNRCTQEDYNRAYELGAVLFVPKPLKQNDLVTFLSSNVNTNESPLDSKTYIYIEDEKIFRMHWEREAKKYNKHLQIFANADDFFAKTSPTPKDAIFYIDRDLGPNQPLGEILAKTLYDQGYKDLYMATSFNSEDFSNMYWIKGVIGKESPWLIS